MSPWFGVIFSCELLQKMLIPIQHVIQYLKFPILQISSISNFQYSKFPVFQISSIQYFKLPVFQASSHKRAILTCKRLIVPTSLGISGVCSTEKMLLVILWFFTYFIVLKYSISCPRDSYFEGFFCFTTILSVLLAQNTDTIT